MGEVERVREKERESEAVRNGRCPLGPSCSQD